VKEKERVLDFQVPFLFLVIPDITEMFTSPIVI